MLQRKRATILVPPAIVCELLRRLALNARGIPGHSIRSLCKELKVNRQTVRAFDRGQYQQMPAGFKRCKCGHLVLMPCRICAARSYAAA